MMSNSSTTSEQLRAAQAGSLRVGLLAQGGGMRGVYSMAALAELDRLGYRDVFSAAAGASAGAINLAYFLAGQAEAAVSVYTDIISNRGFVNPLRFWRIVDIDFLVDVALKSAVPIDVDAVRQSPITLDIDLLNADTGDHFIVNAKDDRYDIFELFRATAALPALYNKKVDIEGRPYVDGATRGGVPIERLYDRGCGLVVAILTRDPTFRRTGHGRLYQWIGGLLARGMSPAVKATIGRPDPLFNESMELIERGALMGTVFVIAPSDPERLVSRTTFDPRRLRDCVAMAREDVQRVLNSCVDQRGGRGGCVDPAT